VQNVSCVDMTPFRRRRDSVEGVVACVNMWQSLVSYGAVIVRDPLYIQDAENDMTALMCRYFEQPEEAKRIDERALGGHQVGCSPSFLEKPYDRSACIRQTGAELLPVLHAAQDMGPGKRRDPKERFFIPHRQEEPHLASMFPYQSQQPVTPEAFLDVWDDVTHKWGQSMLKTIMGVAEIAALGAGEDSHLFSSLLVYGQHLIAPTGSDLDLWGENDGLMLAYEHDDLNFLTGHGRATCQGLYILTQQGKWVLVRVPPGYVLIQAGQQMEIVTGGAVKAGIHCVMTVPQMREYVEARREEGRIPWRTTTTFFATAYADIRLEPLGKFRSEDALAHYPPIYAGKQVEREIALIGI